MWWDVRPWARLHDPRGPFLPGVPMRTSWLPFPSSPAFPSPSITVCTGRTAQNWAQPESIFIRPCRNWSQQSFSYAVLHLLPPAHLSFNREMERDCFSHTFCLVLYKSCFFFLKSQNNSCPQSQINTSACGQSHTLGISCGKSRNLGEVWIRKAGGGIYVLFKAVTASFALSCCLWGTFICRML